MSGLESSQLGKYRLIAKLGQGGMANVWLGVAAGPANFTKLLVIKELRADVSADPEFVTMFQDEARLAARLNHPNVVHTYEVGSDGPRHFIAMEYLEGQPLHLLLSRVKRENMPLALHVRILSDMLAGLQYAHTLRDFDGTPLSIVHRDVSPQNVFVAYDGHVRLVDFGIAKAAGGMAVTQEGVYKGKVAYMAPEQAMSSDVDARTDLFAVGVMLWEALARRRMAQGQPEAAALHARVLGSEPRIRAVIADAPAVLAEICDRAMSVSPADRYASAEDMRIALDDWLSTQPRATSREVSALVSGAFEQERRALAAQIEHQLKLIRRASADESVPILELSAAVSGGTTTPRHRAPASSEAEETAAAGSTVTTPRQKRPPAAVWVGGVTLLIALAAFVASRTSTPGQTSSAAPAASAAAMISLRVAYGPAGAAARLDGHPLGPSPHEATVPRDGRAHLIEVTGADGQVIRQEVVFDRDVSIAVLAPDAAPSAPGLASASSIPSASASPAAVPASNGKQPAGGSRPVDPADPPPKSQRPIDTDNPYR